MALCAPAAARHVIRQVNRRDVWRPRGGDFEEESSLSKLKRHVDSEKNKRAETHADYKYTHREQTADSQNAH